MSHIEKRGKGRYRARFRASNGKERSQTFDRKVDAERWLVAQQSARQTGMWVDPALGRMTFDAWADRWEKSVLGLRDTTRELYLGVLKKYLRPRFGQAPLARITATDVKQMVADDLDAGILSASAVRRHVLVLSVILKSAVDDGRIARNPCAGVKLPPKRAHDAFLEPGEVARLADAIGPHYRPLVLTAAYVGLRWGELAGLMVERVDLLRRRLRVEEQLIDLNGRLSFGPPKTKAGLRTVTIPATLVDELARHFASDAVQSSGLAFPTPNGLPMRRGNFRTVWTRTLERLGWEDEHPLAGLVFHELRHTAAALAIAQGAHPLAIKERLGHSTISVTLDRYGKLFPSLDETLADALDGVLRDSLAASPRPETPKVARLRRS